MAQAGALLTSGARALPAAKPDEKVASSGPRQRPLPQMPLSVAPQVAQSTRFSERQAPDWQEERVQSVGLLSQSVPSGCTRQAKQLPPTGTPLLQRSPAQLLGWAKERSSIQAVSLPEVPLPSLE